MGNGASLGSEGGAKYKSYRLLRAKDTGMVVNSNEKLKHFEEEFGKTYHRMTLINVR